MKNYKRKRTKKTNVMKQGEKIEFSFCINNFLKTHKIK